MCHDNSAVQPSQKSTPPHTVQLRGTSKCYHTNSNKYDHRYVVSRSNHCRNFLTPVPYLYRLEGAFHDPSPRHASHRVRRGGLFRGGDDHAHRHVCRARRNRAPHVQRLVSRWLSPERASIAQHNTIQYHTIYFSTKSVRKLSCHSKYKYKYKYA